MPVLIFAAPAMKENKSLSLDEAFDFSGKDPAVRWKIVKQHNNDDSPMLEGTNSQLSFEPLWHMQYYWLNQTSVVYALLVDESVLELKPLNKKECTDIMFSDSEVATLKDEQYRGIKMHGYFGFNYGLGELGKVGVYEIPKQLFQIAGFYWEDNANQKKTLYLNPKAEQDLFLKTLRKTWARDGNQKEFDRIQKVSHQFIITTPAMNQFFENLNQKRKNKKFADVTIKFEEIENDGSESTTKKLK